MAAGTGQPAGPGAGERSLMTPCAAEQRSLPTRLCQSVITERPRHGAFGWDGGLGTSWLVDPAKDLVVIVLTQRVWETSQPPAVHNDLQDAAYSAIA